MAVAGDARLQFDDSLAAVVRGLFPDRAHLGVAVTTGEGRPESLYAEEAAAIVKAVESRRREFAAGRECLRQAFRQLGIDTGPIEVGRHREPLLPEGVSGSISHCSDLCGAVAARTDVVLSLGFDAEPNQPLDADVRALVCDNTELAWIDARGESADAAWSKLLFAAKEALYKAWFPLQGKYLDFKDVRIHPRVDTLDFAIEWLVDGPVGVRFEGRYAWQPPWVLAGVAARREQPGLV